MFKLKSCPDHFLETARWRFSHVLDVSLDADRVFDIVADGELEKLWFPDFVEAIWNTALPHGANGIRTYRLTYMTIIENFHIWERGKHLQFSVSQCSLPLLQRFLEDYRLERSENGGTLLTWQVCYEPLPAVSFLHPIVRPFFKRDFEKAAANLKRVINDVHEGKILK